MIARQATVCRAALALAIIVPYAYLGGLLATLVHELMGHGLVCMAMGGRFLGFELHLDGMGYAYVPMPPDAAVWRWSTVLMGGVFSTIIFGAAFLLMTYTARRRPWLAIPLLAMAGNLLLEGSPYTFFNAMHPVPPGDIGKVLVINPHWLWRVGFAAAGGVVMVTAIWIITAIGFWLIESWVAAGQQLTGLARLAALLLLNAAAGSLWFTFDWDQLAPGIGLWPNIIGLSLHLLAGMSLFWIRISPATLHVANRPMILSALLGWVTLTVAVVVTAVWLRHGVMWAAW